MITTNERQERLIDRYGELINPSKAKVMRDAGLGIIESKREGPYVWDQEGIRYLDCRDDAGLYNVGRRNPDVCRALSEALARYDIGNPLFFSEPRVQLAQKLGSISPGGKLGGVTYGASGAETVDFAIKLARAATGRKKVVAMKGAYHGSSGAALAVSGGSSSQKPGARARGDIKHVAFGDLEALKRAVTRDTACVIMEPIQWRAGLELPPDGYLGAARDVCRAKGALLIIDEIQTGLGRTGAMFACEWFGVVPDILLLGKALSGGLYPIAAAVFEQRLLDYWTENPLAQVSSFAGSDLGCVAALATLEFIETNHLPERVTHLERALADGFGGLRAKYPRLIKNARIKGLLISVEFTGAEIGPQMSRDLSQQRLLASYVPEAPEKMRLLPSLVIGEEDAQAIITAFDNALAGFSTVSTLRETGVDQLIAAIQ